MERVQFHQEQMLPELKDYAKKDIFTSAEIKQIIKRRTAFETALVRRVADKADFLRYAAYELNLEALRKKRVERLNVQSVPSISDYAIVRRLFYIFERAVRKFRADVALWTQYIDVARTNGAKALAGKICARALQLHPTVPSLYILASQHEISQGSFTSGRALLQRGLRLNNESVELWTEYVKMELGFVESMRRRWDILGIDEENQDTTEEGPEDDARETRKAVLKGAVVRAVIDSAVKALPSFALFELITRLLSDYPSPLAGSLLSYLHSHIQQTLPENPQALLLRAAHPLSRGISGDELVDGIKAANEELMDYARRLGGEMGIVYGRWAEEWIGRAQEEESTLAQYLILSLHCLVTSLPRSQISPELALIHLRLLSARRNELAVALPDPLRLARRYTSHFSGDPELWLERIQLEDTDRLDVVREARRSCTDMRVWQWELDLYGEDWDEEKLGRIYEPLLAEAMAYPAMHTSLLLRYITLLPEASVVPALRRHATREAIYPLAFSHLAQKDASGSSGVVRDSVRHTLGDVYRSWRVVDGQEGPASLAFAEWLLRAGEGAEAAKVIGRARHVAGVEEGWRSVLTRMQSAAAETTL